MILSFAQAIPHPTSFDPSQCQKTLHTLIGNKFDHERGWDQAVAAMGDGFVEAVAGLGPGDHWLDSGAGSALVQREALHRGLLKPNVWATSLGYQIPEAHVGDIAADQVAFPRFHYLSDRLLQSYLPGELRPAKLITDFYGPFFYADDPALIVQQMLSLTDPGGESWIHFPTTALYGRLYFHSHSLILVDDPHINFDDVETVMNHMVDIRCWLEKFQGVEVELTQSYEKELLPREYREFMTLGLRLRKPSSAFYIPPLTSVRITAPESGSPERIFLIPKCLPRRLSF